LIEIKNFLTLVSRFLFIQDSLKTRLIWLKTLVKIEHLCYYFRHCLYAGILTMDIIPPGYVNVAAITHSTQALGPGDRAVVWVQGCPFHCDGCMAPGWGDTKRARLIFIDNLVDELMVNPKVSGLTFSGGEPMRQARSLACVANMARKKREIDIITFSGFRLEQLQKEPADTGIPDLLAQTDVLIDGPYVKSLNNGIGLRGSSNQRIIHLTSRLKGLDLENYPRRIEIQLHDREALMIGIPPDGVLDSVETALGGSELKERISHERI
jgi:anaerobic ribonucleoside-triphosphate reductase activating protein